MDSIGTINGWRLLQVLFGWLLLATCVFGEPVDFAHEVLPILKQRCAECHTNGTYKGGLSFDTRAAILGADVVELGDSANSELIRRVLSRDEDERMPPKGEPLTAAEVALLSKWIDAKLPWQDGFSFKAQSYVARLELRQPVLPDDYRGNPIDYWVRQYYAQPGVVETDVLPPQKHTEISDEAFLRRVYLDLGGLLPSLDEQRQFLEAEAKTRRFEAIDRLLSDEQRYAEHWLSFWNDHLRNDYRGTGFIDGGRKQITSWLYRSLRENKPYDQFVRELISPDESSAGFIKGIKWRGRVNASQVPALQFAQNTAQVFLGINLKCASCHDSFIDDWKLADAYGMAAIISDSPLELHRCDKPTGATARAKFVFPELGEIDSGLSREERLARLAELMTDERNGRFSRTIVNRLWQQLMGRGIVHPVDVMSNAPWSEDLLDWLAADFVAHGYDLKHTLRQITQSQTYQSQAVRWPEDAPEEDWRFSGPLVKRMTAEQFSDAMWDVTDTHPAKTAVDFGERVGAVRASLVESDPLMRSLGRPNREQVVTVRPDRLTTLQALDLSNGAVIAETLQRGAQNTVGSGSLDSDAFEPAKFVQQLFQRALTRQPSARELGIAQELMGDSPSAESIADLLWAVIMLPEFQTVQ